MYDIKLNYNNVRVFSLRRNVTKIRDEEALYQNFKKNLSDSYVCTFLCVNVHMCTVRSV